MDTIPYSPPRGEESVAFVRISEKKVLTKHYGQWEMETPLGHKGVVPGAWVTKRVYTPEQQTRLGCDEDGNRVRPRAKSVSPRKVTVPPPTNIEAEHAKSMERIAAINRMTELERQRRGARNTSKVTAIETSSEAVTTNTGLNFGRDSFVMKPAPVTALGMPRERTPGALEVFSLETRPATGPYCQGDAWYWQQAPSTHSRYTYESARSPYKLTSGHHTYGEDYGVGPHALGYPYSKWRHFPFNPNHIMEKEQGVEMRKHHNAPHVCVTRGARINQEAAETWLAMEQEMAAAVQERKDRAIWLQADYSHQGREAPSPANDGVYIF